MKIYRNFEQIEGQYTACIGFFDGVHCGHRYLLQHLCTEAKQHGTMSAVVTFANHPRRLVQPDFPLLLVDTLEERLDKLAATGIDACFLLDFTEEIRQHTAEQFIRDVLSQQMHITRLLIGYDHRFGRNRSEGFDDYVRYGKEIGIEVIECDPLELKDGKRVSSTLVRELLAEGRVDEAADCLGHRYSVEGKVVGGYREGRKIGFPTANLDIDPLKIVPVGGVYAVKVHVEGDMVLHPGMMNIGHRPTYGVNGLTLETNIFRFREDIYDKRIKVEFCKKLRDERCFDSITSLTRQLSEDALQANEYLLHPEALPLTRKHFLRPQD